jgi:EAL domain-containing protein (putative c-di-GMP-specific phosphodiesterase class I)
LGFEALLRWQHPERGLIPLGEFLPVLESSSLMLDVGLQIFEQVVATMAQWQAKGVHLPVSFNVSNGELLSEHFRASLSRLVKQAGVSPDQIYLEITETVLANLGGTGEDIFTELQQAGFRLSVDDFGVGTSSLSRLRSIPLREIKVDRSFITDVTSSSRDLELLRGIVNLAKSLGLEVVIEGVESPQQLSIAKSLGHLSIQGFCYSRAVNPMQAFELIERQPFAIH